MTQFNADSMHRLAKMALDAGEVASPEEAVALFSRYRLRIHLGHGWANTLAGQACFLTALNTAMRAFLGGVEVYGDLGLTLDVPLYQGRSARGVAEELGAPVVTNASTALPTLVLGAAPDGPPPAFCVQLSWDHWRFAIAPVSVGGELTCTDDNPLAGIGAAALGVNEAFMHVRGDLAEAGHRSVGMSLWNPVAVVDWRDDAHKGPKLAYLPKSLWLIGLGHLGQAYAWTLGMLPYPVDGRPHLVLQDFDKAAKSNLSTCLLLWSADLLKPKVRAVASRLEAAGFTTALVERRFGPRHRVMVDEPIAALFGVDNVAARRDLDTAEFSLVVEAGLGSGYRDFRNIRMHTFPGSRQPSQIWTAESTAQAATELNDTYKKLADERKDICGMSLLASRAVATPFVGALAAVLALAEVMRPLHGGLVYATLDVQLKSLRHRTGAAPAPYQGLQTAFVQAEKRPSGPAREAA
ncbi:ThiF family protein [Variovorax sp. YR634]|uniref:ThiF family adenylyltransferase n=1 Tax=Variovorax sp. YR634 TaxID=1884385 RepID=UPI000898937B|nr:ThiF family adenylyltransferase [Variovorax sp. YR634]SDY18679.1 ThiF family protein [Variovorax sp. YR634]